jgi:hypothetical protein
LTLAGGSFQAGTLALAGGRVAAIGGATFDMSRVALLQGQGTVAGAVAGGASAQIVADGPLVLGDALRSDGFVYDGTLLTHGQRVELRSAGWSQLGRKNTLESGAVLAAANGVALLAGARLVADGDVTIDAAVWQRGQVASGGTLTFGRNVLGGGGFEGGSFVFLASYAPGDGVATVDFGGADTTFGVDSVLAIQIVGVASHDRLTGLHAMHFDGALHLDFGPGFEVGTATTIDLLDFVAFDGATTLPPRVVVSGFDAARLDLSRLDIDGTLTIAAVPEPAAVALLLLGLAAIGPLLRRAHADPRPRRRR